MLLQNLFNVSPCAYETRSSEFSRKARVKFTACLVEFDAVWAGLFHLQSPFYFSKQMNPLSALPPAQHACVGQVRPP